MVGVDALGRPAGESAGADRAARAIATAGCRDFNRRRTGRRRRSPWNRYGRRSRARQSRLDGIYHRMTSMQLVQRSQTTKYIFVTGGVVSSLGLSLIHISEPTRLL